MFPENFDSVLLYLIISFGPEVPDAFNSGELYSSVVFNLPIVGLGFGYLGSS